VKPIRYGPVHVAYSGVGRLYYPYLKDGKWSWLCSVDMALLGLEHPYKGNLAVKAVLTELDLDAISLNFCG